MDEVIVDEGVGLSGKVSPGLYFEGLGFRHVDAKLYNNTINITNKILAG